MICIDEEVEQKSMIYHVSLGSGLLLSCICGSFFTLIPTRNVMEQPTYWYLDHIYRSFGSFPLISSITFVGARYWSNFSFPKFWETCLILITLGCVVFFGVLFGYSLFWVYHLENSPPIAMSQHLAGIVMSVAMNIGIWFR